MIGVFSYDIAKYGVKGLFNPALTADLTKCYVFGITPGGPTKYGPLVLKEDAHDTLCNRNHPPETTPIIVKKYCPAITGNYSPYWFCVDNGTFYEALTGAAPEDWPQQVSLQGLAEWLADHDVDDNTIAKLVDYDFETTLQTICTLNGMPNFQTPPPAPTEVPAVENPVKKLKAKLAVQNPYKWVLKNGVVTYPAPWPTAPPKTYGGTVAGGVGDVNWPSATYSDEMLNEMLKNLKPLKPVNFGTL
jgi:hypothetical protein